MTVNRRSTRATRPGLRVHSCAALGGRPRFFLGGSSSASSSPSPSSSSFFFGGEDEPSSGFFLGGRPRRRFSGLAVSSPSAGFGCETDKHSQPHITSIASRSRWPRREEEASVVGKGWGTSIYAIRLKAEVACKVNLEVRTHLGRPASLLWRYISGGASGRDSSGCRCLSGLFILATLRTTATTLGRASICCMKVHESTCERKDLDKRSACRRLVRA